MLIVTGVTGQVGGIVARALLAAGKDVRAIVRQPAKAARWRELGCDVAEVDLLDSQRLAEAFAGAEVSSSCCHPTSIRRRAFPNRAP